MGFVNCLLLKLLFALGIHKFLSGDVALKMKLFFICQCSVYLQPKGNKMAVLFYKQISVHCYVGFEGYY